VSASIAGDDRLKDLRWELAVSALHKGPFYEWFALPTVKYRGPTMYDQSAFQTTFGAVVKKQSSRFIGSIRGLALEARSHNSICGSGTLRFINRTAVYNFLISVL
jgi:hypothetical protein